MMPAAIRIEREKLHIERARLKIEQERFRSEERSRRRSLAAMVSVTLAAVTLAAALLSLVQIYIQSLETEKAWKLDLARFIMEHQESIFSHSSPHRDRISFVIFWSFPPDLSEKLFKDMSFSSGPEREIGERGMQLVRSKQRPESDPSADERFRFYRDKGIEEARAHNPKCIASFQRALRIRPSDARTLYYLAWAYRHVVDDDANARTLIQRAIEAGFSADLRLKDDGFDEFFTPVSTLKQPQEVLP